MEFPRRTSNLIAALRGLPADRNLSTVRPAFDLGSLIEILERKYKIGQEKLEDLIAREWKHIVGEEAAHRSCPQRIASGSILLIQVGNPTLRHVLQTKQRDILNRIQRLPGGHIIHALNFRAG